MRKITTGDMMHIYGCFGAGVDYTVRTTARLAECIDMDRLRWALGMTARRYPHFCVRLRNEKLIIFYSGALAMTAMSVENSLCDFSQSFAVGLADAASMLVGVLFGEMNDEGIREADNCIHRNCALFCGATCLIFLGN